MIRLLRADDSIEDLTALLHLAYQPLHARGMHYTAATQTPADTRRRCAEGTCFVAEIDGEVVGTGTRSRIEETDGCAWLDRPDCAVWQQFAVHPEYQGHGLGRMLMEAAVVDARAAGVAELAIDTSEHAHELIAFYERYGFRHVDTVNWSNTNYLSVVMSKSLRES